MGRLRPSTPRMYVMLNDGIHSAVSMNWNDPVDASKIRHKYMANANCIPVVAADTCLISSVLSRGIKAMATMPSTGSQMIQLSK